MKELELMKSNHKEIEFILKNLKLDAVFMGFGKEITGRLNTFNKSFDNNEELESYLLEYLQEGYMYAFKGFQQYEAF